MPCFDQLAVISNAVVLHERLQQSDKIYFSFWLMYILYICVFVKCLIEGHYVE